MIDALIRWSLQLLLLSIGVISAIFFFLSAAFGSSRDGLLIMLNLVYARFGRPFLSAHLSHHNDRLRMESSLDGGGVQKGSAT